MASSSLTPAALRRTLILFVAAQPAALQPYAGDTFTVEVRQVNRSSIVAEFCATAPYKGGPIPVTRARWSVRGDDGVTYQALATDVGAGYPIETTVDVGKCVFGEVPFTLPDSVDIAQVVYASTLGATTWTVP